MINEKDFRNDLLKRREIEFVLNSHDNPGYVNVTKEIVERFKVKEEQISIKSIKNNFGSNNFVIKAFIYDSLVDKEKIEPKKKIKKEKKAKQEKKE